MRNNFIITYLDLNRPGQDYSRIHDAIKSTGNVPTLQYSRRLREHCVLPLLSMRCDHWRRPDPNDRLLIGDPRTLYLRGISQADIDAINRVWFADWAAQAA
jgi:hypothetical protein